MNCLDRTSANVIKGRYNFDIAASPPTPSPVIDKEAALPPAPPQPVIPAGPRPSLMQTLLSEASIKIYLYLGAFFVIASALILAAVVEAARLPILAVATLAFGGGALLIRKRLPQPSFAFFIVFSFLLPIDANVLKETIGFVEPFLSIYWTVIFLAHGGHLEFQHLVLRVKVFQRGRLCFIKPGILSRRSNFQDGSRTTNLSCDACFSGGVGRYIPIEKMERQQIFPVHLFARAIAGARIIVRLSRPRDPPHI